MDGFAALAQGHFSSRVGAVGRHRGGDGGQGGQDAGDDFDGFVDRHGCAVGDEVLDGVSLNVLHDDVGTAMDRLFASSMISSPVSYTATMFG